MGSKIEHPSGRVIAVGRLLLAALFLIAIVVDASQPVRAPAATYAILVLYLVFAATLVVMTWSNWWLDAKFAGPAHAFDIVLFTLLVLLTEGYTSPFFTFFMFLLLSAAIRWGWKETALTAILLTLLYLVTGLLVIESSAVFELQRFVVRTGHLVILSLILIWFGVNQWGVRALAEDDDPLAYPLLDQSPLETGLKAVMKRVRARIGSLVWHEEGEVTSLTVRDDMLKAVPADGRVEVAPKPFIYDLREDRGLERDEERNLCAIALDRWIGPKAASALGLRDGIAIPVRTDRGQGMLFLERVPNLSVDHLDRGEQISANMATHFQRHALLRAAEENAEARSRLMLARDLHDSVVQFLAGAAFRLEALKRAVAAGRSVDSGLNELQQLMLQEQVELRAFISALRGAPRVTFDELARDLDGLANRLCHQWDIECSFAAAPAEVMIPARLQLDAQHLVREAVANAVRHADAKSVEITLDARPDEIRLVLINDGARYPRKGRSVELPHSLKERVEQAGGELDVSRGMDVTRLTVTLPLGGRRR